MELTFEELNEFSIDEFLRYANIWTEDYKEDGTGSAKKRKATQSDIDRILG